MGGRLRGGRVAQASEFTRGVTRRKLLLTPQVQCCKSCLALFPSLWTHRIQLGRGGCVGVGLRAHLRHHAGKLLLTPLLQAPLSFACPLSAASPRTHRIRAGAEREAILYSHTSDSAPSPQDCSAC